MGGRVFLTMQGCAVTPKRKNAPGLFRDRGRSSFGSYFLPFFRGVGAEKLNLISDAPIPWT